MKDNNVVQKLEKYAEYFSDAIESKFINFSESKYNEALKYINNIISNKNNYDSTVFLYAEYLLSILTHNKIFRKYKLKILNQYYESNN